MSLDTIISSIDAEIERLTQAKSLIAAGVGGDGKLTSLTISAKRPRKRTLSAAARKRIAEAQRKRWAKAKKAAK